MWTLKKPSLEAAIGEDLDNLVNHCDALSEADKQPLKILYEQYDHQSGSITKVQHNSIPENKAQAIKGQYYKTDKGESHYYMRNALEADVYRCPYCSINQPDTLDHYMPQSDFPAIAMCRLNLVPMCGDCNRKKRDFPFSQFVHSYYQSFPEVQFLKATSVVQGDRILISFFLDESVVDDAALLGKLKFQIEKIDLLERINKAAISFIEDLCIQCHCFIGVGFKIWLKNRLADHVKMYGQNDWRTASIRAILNNPAINHRLFKSISDKAKAISPGP